VVEERGEHHTLHLVPSPSPSILAWDSPTPTHLPSPLPTQVAPAPGASTQVFADPISGSSTVVRSDPARLPVAGASLWTSAGGSAQQRLSIPAERIMRVEFGAFATTRDKEYRIRVAFADGVQITDEREVGWQGVERGALGPVALGTPFWTTPEAEQAHRATRSWLGRCLLFVRQPFRSLICSSAPLPPSNLPFRGQADPSQSPAANFTATLVGLAPESGTLEVTAPTYPPSSPPLPLGNGVPSAPRPPTVTPRRL